MMVAMKQLGYSEELWGGVFQEISVVYLGL
jgi:hypothetical protein